jgi:glycosyltransferase involved in cell wall biosynthesis
VHAYFAHTPAEVGDALARRLRVPFGFSVHARDARKIPRAQLHERARRAACVVACNTDVAAELEGSGAHLHLVPHGVDLDRFHPHATEAAPVLRLLAVGRLVEKKGFHVLLDALAAIPGAWQLRIVGDGPARERLSAQAQALGIADQVTFAGALTHETLPLEYSGADIVAVPSIVDSSGDREGLPNVVLEAMASGRAIVATDTGAIASAIHDGDTGLLVPAASPGALTRALTRLANAPHLRTTLGLAARRTAENLFDVRHCTNHLASVLREAYV